MFAMNLRTPADAGNYEEGIFLPFGFAVPMVPPWLCGVWSSESGQRHGDRTGRHYRRVVCAVVGVAQCRPEPKVQLSPWLSPRSKKGDRNWWLSQQQRHPAAEPRRDWAGYHLEGYGRAGGGGLAAVGVRQQPPPPTNRHLRKPRRRFPAHVG
jgi:hypothetical protein